MPGIYLHIPFCKQACHYCNFHFSTSLRKKNDLIQAILSEIEMTVSFLSDTQLESIYFGGGTPSLLSPDELSEIFHQIGKYYDVRANAEVTLECNPDDLTEEKLKSYRRLGINRLSIGVQSLQERDLTLLNRAHTVEDAIRCIKLISDCGIENFSIDLIYGIPGQGLKEWKMTLEQMIDLEIPHLSCYQLTVEPRTAMSKWVRTGKINMPSDGHVNEQFDLLMELTESSYSHYEISNFARSGFEAIHNTNYWKQKAYLGIGPSAHSYDGEIRRWNISHNIKYIREITAGLLPFEEESLSKEMQYNEYIMLSLRTRWGVSLERLRDLEPGTDTRFLELIKPFAEKGWIRDQGQSFVLTREGKRWVDRIAMECFWV